MCKVLWMATSVSHQVRLCQRRGTSWPAFGPVLTKPLAQGDSVVFIFSIAWLSRFFWLEVAAPIACRLRAIGGCGGGGGGGSGGGGGGGGGGGDGGGGNRGMECRGPQSVQSVPYAQVFPVTLSSPAAPSWQYELLP